MRVTFIPPYSLPEIEEEMNIIPRVGELVFFDGKPTYEVTYVYWRMSTNDVEIRLK